MPQEYHWFSVEPESLECKWKNVGSGWVAFFVSFCCRISFGRVTRTKTAANFVKTSSMQTKETLSARLRNITPGEKPSRIKAQREQSFSLYGKS